MGTERVGMVSKTRMKLVIPSHHWKSLKYAMQVGTERGAMVSGRQRKASAMMSTPEII